MHKLEAKLHFTQDKYMQTPIPNAQSTMTPVLSSGSTVDN